MNPAFCESWILRLRMKEVGPLSSNPIRDPRLFKRLGCWVVAQGGAGGKFIKSGSNGEQIAHELVDGLDANTHHQPKVLKIEYND